jgi:hypothetical protein
MNTFCCGFVFSFPSQIMKLMLIFLDLVNWQVVFEEQLSLYRINAFVASCEPVAKRGNRFLITKSEGIQNRLRNRVQYLNWCWPPTARAWNVVKTTLAIMAASRWPEKLDIGAQLARRGNVRTWPKTTFKIICASLYSKQHLLVWQACHINNNRHQGIQQVASKCDRTTEMGQNWSLYQRRHSKSSINATVPVLIRVKTKIFVFVFSQKKLTKSCKHFYAKTFAKIIVFAKSKNFVKRNFSNFREKWTNFRLFSLFAKMKKGFSYQP